MNEEIISSKYSVKAKDSFNTKLNLYVFDKSIRESIQEVNLEDFRKFRITEELILIYTTKYWNWLPGEEFCTIPSSVDLRKYTKMTINELYQFMRKWKENNKTIIEIFEKDYVSNFEQVFPKSEFIEMIKSTDTCFYCGISIPEVNQLAYKEQLFNKQFSRGFVLEIDRINSNQEYKRDNCVMCCYWCNNAKTDEFDKDEFIIIGRAIKEVWSNRLKKPSIC